MTEQLLDPIDTEAPNAHRYATGGSSAANHEVFKTHKVIHLFVSTCVSWMSTLVSLFIMSGDPHEGWARNFRVSQVPHGNTFSCRTCHLGAGGGAVNSFGYDVSLRLVDGNADWPSLCALDSDEDGYTNAEELGDPDCAWREGDPAPNVSPTAPGDAGSFPQPILPDMMTEDMAPPVDLGPLPDAAPPVEMFSDVWDAAMYDWSQRDIFMTTEEPWVGPDLGARSGSTDDQSVDSDRDVTPMIEPDQGSMTEDDAGESVGGEEIFAGESGIGGTSSAKSDDQSGCQQRHTNRAPGATLFILLGVWFMHVSGRRRTRSEIA